MPPPIKNAITTINIVVSSPKDLLRFSTDLTSTSGEKRTVGLGASGGGDDDGAGRGDGGYFVDSVSLTSICLPYKVPIPDLFNRSPYVQNTFWSRISGVTTSGASLDFRTGRFSMVISPRRVSRWTHNPTMKIWDIVACVPKIGRTHLGKIVQEERRQRDTINKSPRLHRIRSSIALNQANTQGGRIFASHLA